ncbi:MAG: hypothetical protein ACK56F_17975, partial [bacterium]
MNTGKTPNLATNETTVGTFSSTTLTYKGDQILYVVAISNDANPIVSFSYRFYEVKTLILPNCTQWQDYEVQNGVIKCVDIEIPPPIIIQNVSQNITVIKKNYNMTGQKTPLYG